VEEDVLLLEVAVVVAHTLLLVVEVRLLEPVVGLGVEAVVWEQGVDGLSSEVVVEEAHILLLVVEVRLLEPVAA